MKNETKENLIKIGANIAGCAVVFATTFLVARLGVSIGYKSGYVNGYRNGIHDIVELTQQDAGTDTSEVVNF